MYKKNGFTVIEILVALTLISFAIGLTVSLINWKDRVSSNTASKLENDFAAIEMGLTNYSQEKNAYPDCSTNGLSDTKFVPIYLFAPKAPTGFDVGTDYANSVNGYMLNLKTTGSAPDRGYYICGKVTVANASDANFIAIKKLSTDLSTSKYFYNSACPATTNADDPSGSTTLYPTYWITRY